MTQGTGMLNGERIDQRPPHALREVRGRRIGMIFQDPLTSLDPLQTVGDQLTESMQVHLRINHHQARERAVELLNGVGIEQPELRLDQYPHQFSGGMRSEEHTSELQSLMRISYAVFCLKKKKTAKNNKNQP